MIPKYFQKHHINLIDLKCLGVVVFSIVSVGLISTASSQIPLIHQKAFEDFASVFTV